MSDFFSLPPQIVRSDVRHPQLSRWLERAREVLGAVHENRLKEWALARFALDQKLTEIYGLSLLEKEFDGHHRLKHHPEFMFSLSHSKDWAGAWVLPNSTALGVGLDLELKSRKISHEVFQRMHHPDDVNLDLTVHWAIKEAAYKSLPATIQNKIWLNSIKVKRGTFEVRGQPASGVWHLFPHDQLVIAGAVLTT